MSDPDFIHYLVSAVPGIIHTEQDRYQIQHTNGDFSTVWRRHEVLQKPSRLAQVFAGFDEFDGADLFSSTFKIASQHKSQTLNGVEITPTLPELLEIASQQPRLSLGDSIPFMTESGIWIYLFEESNDSIRKWNLEDQEECETYPSLRAILDEWVQVVSE